MCTPTDYPPYTDSDDAPTVVRTGADVLLVYPQGDADTVRVLSLTPTRARVQLPNGSTADVLPEDLGVGVDDSLVVVYDDHDCAAYDCRPDDHPEWADDDYGTDGHTRTCGSACMPSDGYYTSSCSCACHRPVPTQADLARDVTADRPWHYQHNDSPTDSDPVRPGRYCGPHCDLWEDPDPKPRDTNGHPATSPGGAIADHTHTGPGPCPFWTRQPCPDRLVQSLGQALAYQAQL